MSQSPLSPVEEAMPHISAVAAEPEYYEEPPRMTGADIAGVVAALLALFVIGISGYVWLNPDLGWQDLTSRFTAGRGGQAASSRPSAQGSTEAESPGAAETPGAAGAPGDRLATSCPECGMFTDATLGQVQARWSDGTGTYHDCWTCAMKYGSAQGLDLESARVLDYAAGLESRRELDAAGAAYLYGVNELEGSMKPYVAAFADRASAQAAQAKLGGELLDFAGLREKLGQELSGK
jgi:hypothetical protein